MKKKLILMIMICLLLFVFSGLIIYLFDYPPFTTSSTVNYRYCSLDDYPSKNQDINYTSIATVEDNQFIGIIYPYQITNTVLISREEHFDYYNQLDYKGTEEDLYYQFTHQKVHVNREKYKRLLMNEYSIDISIYHDGFYLQYGFHSSDVKENVDFENEEELKQFVFIYIEDMIDYYEDNKEEILFIYNQANK